MKQGGARDASSVVAGANFGRAEFTISGLRQQWCRLAASVHRQTRFARSELRSSGFTIVETLIVLAVTSALFISIAAVINGKQNRTQFMVSINALRQQIQQSGNEVSSGYFPDTQDFSCTGHPPNSPTIDTIVMNKQGTNGSCIFLGKVLYMGLPSSSSEFETFAAFTIAGNRVDDTGAEVTQLYGPSGGDGGAEPIVAAPTLNSGIYSLHNGLTPVAMYYNGSIANQTSAFGFLSSLASVDSTNAVSSGSQNFNLYAVRNTTINDSSLGNGSNMDLELNNAAANVNPTNAFVRVNNVVICVASGGTNQSGRLTVGGKARPQNVDLKIFSNRTCT